MKKKILLLKIYITLLFAAAAFMGSSDIIAQADDPVIIVNKALTSVGIDEAKRAITGKITNWSAGGQVQVLFNSERNISETFCNKVLGMSFTVLNNLWVKISIKDGVPAPRNVASSVAVTLVSNSNKFIAFVKRSEANDSVRIIE